MKIYEVVSSWGLEENGSINTYKLLFWKNRKKISFEEWYRMV